MMLPVQTLLPSLSDLVFGSPVERRRWLDWGLFHVKPDYLRTLREYLKILKQRNAALKSFARGDLRQPEIDVWTEGLLVVSQQLDAQRRDYMVEVIAETLMVLRRLSPGMEIAMTYRRGWSESESLEKVLSDSQARDVKLGATSAGPHRCDIALGTGGGVNSKASLVLSRGQGKLLASAMVLGQARLLMRATNRNSVFLIDDLGAEMDQKHSAALFRILQEMSSQILATSTHPPGESGMLSKTPVTMFHVEHGKVGANP
jgi:DNA replication and repair protein RecF